jgi:hypothetical protein
VADTVSCRCRGSCGFHEEPCGRPVEKPFDVAPVVEGSIGLWHKYGLCELCWNGLEAAGKL